MIDVHPCDWPPVSASHDICRARVSRSQDKVSASCSHTTEIDHIFSVTIIHSQRSPISLQVVPKRTVSSYHLFKRIRVSPLTVTFGGHDLELVISELVVPLGCRCIPLFRRSARRATILFKGQRVEWSHRGHGRYRAERWAGAPPQSWWTWKMEDWNGNGNGNVMLCCVPLRWRELSVLGHV